MALRLRCSETFRGNTVITIKGVIYCREIYYCPKQKNMGVITSACLRRFEEVKE